MSDDTQSAQYGPGECLACGTDGAELYTPDGDGRMTDGPYCDIECSAERVEASDA